MSLVFGGFVPAPEFSDQLVHALNLGLFGILMLLGLYSLFPTFAYCLCNTTLIFVGYASGAIRTHDTISSLRSGRRYHKS